ncbi:polymorphic toxin type 35 domain-containing protein [Brevibacillus laterosporus]
MQVAGETVEVTFIRLPNGQIKISDAWVKTLK